MSAELIVLVQRLGQPRVLGDPVRGPDYRKYHGCSAITPNRLEAGLAAGRVLTSAAEALSAAAELRERLDLEAAVVTLDRDGMALAHADGRREAFPTRPRPPGRSPCRRGGAPWPGPLRGGWG